MKLKSKTGCLTCVRRRKKCDEGIPECAECRRLGLTCVQRTDELNGKAMTISSTNLKARASQLSLPISNGYPPFRSELEKQLAVESRQVLLPMISRMAGEEFKDIWLFGQFCTQDRLVRDAITAFSAYGQGSRSSDSYKVSVNSYQRCVMRLMGDQSFTMADPARSDTTLVAILFLGLVEGLKHGDPSASLAHFEMCRKILSTRLKHATAPIDREMLNIYRIVAESIMYNFATFSPFHPRIDMAVEDWEDSFDCLFIKNDRFSSPFFAGFPGIYQVMFRVSVLLRRANGASGVPLQRQRVEEAVSDLWQQLDELEDQIPTLYTKQPGDSRAIKLYKAKHTLFVYSLRIHLLKILRPDATAKDPGVELYFSKAMVELTTQEDREKWNPSLRWPLTILACAASSDEDFELVCSVMQDYEKILDPANSRKLASAQNVLICCRRGLKTPCVSAEQSGFPQDTMDLLLEPRALDPEDNVDSVPLQVKRTAYDRQLRTSVRPAAMKSSVDV